jgi:hypothetical protein
VSRNVAKRAAWIGIAASIACAVSAGGAEQQTTIIDITKSGIGVSPADFEFQRTGDGDLGQWTVVRDPKDARIALWTQEDNVTRFDHIEIRALPPTEWR